jgi:lysozyme
MEANLLERIKEQLVRHEGLRLKPHRCTVGKLTIGVGRNLDDCGISQAEAYVLLENDIQNCEKQLVDEIPEIYDALDEVRKSVLMNMCFNLGINGLLEFKNPLVFIGAGSPVAFEEQQTDSFLGLLGDVVLYIGSEGIFAILVLIELHHITTKSELSIEYPGGDRQIGSGDTLSSQSTIQAILEDQIIDQADVDLLVLQQR